MAYRLHSLAPGSYDLALDGAIVGSVVREIRSGFSCEPAFDLTLVSVPVIASCSAYVS
jgi:hypothetical protein